MIVRLTARHLRCRYRDRLALVDLSLSVRSGKVLALVGPNGAGKTTTLRVLARILKPEAGEVFLDGAEIWSIPPRDYARRVAFTPELQTSTWSLTVYQTVALGRAPHRGWFLPWSRTDRQVMEEALEQVGLVDFRHRSLSTLSAGELQRVLLARALAQQAEVLLLDEPTAHLDLKHQTEILRRLRSLAHQRHLAVLLTLHDLNQAAAYADEIGLMRGGKLLAWGDAGTVLTKSNLQRAYEVEVELFLHPVSGKPLILTCGDGPEAASSKPL